MKKAAAIAAILSLTGVLYAGGAKAVAPVEAPVAPIPPTISPIPAYIGLGLLASFVDRDPCPCNGADLSDRRAGGILRLGYDFNNYFGIEARGLRTFGNNVFSKVTHYGLYLKPQYHFADQANVYGLLGYGHTVVDYTNGIRSSHNPKNGLSFGGGIEYDFGKDKPLEGVYDRVFDGQGDQEKGWGMWIDVQHLLRNEGVMHTDSNIVSVGITYDF